MQPDHARRQRGADPVPLPRADRPGADRPRRRHRDAQSDVVEPADAAGAATATWTICSTCSIRSRRELRQMTALFDATAGVICESLRIDLGVADDGHPRPQCLAVSLLKLDADKLMAVLADATAEAQREQDTIAAPPQQRRAHRRADPDAEPARGAGADRPDDEPRQARPAATSPCCSSISTASSRSTIRSAPPPATRCWSPWPAACAPRCARQRPVRIAAAARWRRASAATNSSSSSTACARTADVEQRRQPPARHHRQTLRHRRPRHHLQCQHRHRAWRLNAPGDADTVLRDASIAMALAKRGRRAATWCSSNPCANAPCAAATSKATCAARCTTTSCSCVYQPVVGLLPDGAHRPLHRRRSAGALAAPAARRGAAAGIHRSGRGMRPDRRAGRLRARRACSDFVALANHAGRQRPAPAGGQPVARPAGANRLRRARGRHSCRPPACRRASCSWK